MNAAKINGRTMETQVIDCHAHIIDPSQFSYEHGPGYKPGPRETGTQAAYVDALNRAKIAYALLVQPSCYGFDNTALIDTMRRYPGRFKAIGMFPPNASDATLDLHAQEGIVGARFNLVSYDPGILRKRDTKTLLRRIKARGWFAEVVADGTQWRRDAEILLNSDVRVLVDHFGMHAFATRITEAGFQAVLDIGRSSDAVIKLTTPFSLGLPRHQHHRVQPFVECLLEAFGIDRCVWGSDWPFLTVPDPPEIPEVLAFLDRCVPDVKDRQKILWNNPLKLFGFGAKLNE